MSQLVNDVWRSIERKAIVNWLLREADACIERGVAMGSFMENYEDHAKALRDVARSIENEEHLR